MVDQSCSKPIATNPIPDLNTIAFAVEGPAYSSENETHVAYRPQSLYLIGTDGVIAAVLAPDDPQHHDPQRTSVALLELVEDLRARARAPEAGTAAASDEDA